MIDDQAHSELQKDLQSTCPALPETFNYHGLMTKKLICALGSFWLSAPLLLAQTVAPAPPLPDAVMPAEKVVSAPVQVSTLDAQLFYQLLVGELSTVEGEPSAGFALMLDAAQKTNDAQLYQRATEIALQSRSGDAALQAVRAWRQAQPESREAIRYQLQILIVLNRPVEASEALKTELSLAPPADRLLAIDAVPRAFARVTDKKLAASAVEQALEPYLTDPASASVAWATVGRMRLLAGDPSSALEAAKKSQTANLRSETAALIALEVMQPTQPAAEVLVKNYLADNVKAMPEIRMGYARTLLDAQRYAEATAQLQIVIREKPDFAPAWLVLGSLQLQDNQLAPAQISLERYVALARTPGAEDEPNRGLAQAYMSLAQIAEKRKDFAGAEAWIAKIENPEDMLLVQARRASLLASQGKLAEGLQLIKNLPAKTPVEARSKLTAEIALLREFKQYQQAYDLLAEAAIMTPADAELLYDQAMMAEKIGKLPEMETLLRRVIELKPDYHSAYNALGYSFADRNMRLQEAKELINKALEYAPGDPFIRDSLGWVEFRLGNSAEAAKIFESAFKASPDAEIAAHFGEVLWSVGQSDKALAIWREGQLLNPENPTLLETLKRLRVRL